MMHRHPGAACKLSARERDLAGNPRLKALLQYRSIAHCSRRRYAHCWDQVRRSRPDPTSTLAAARGPEMTLEQGSTWLGKAFGGRLRAHRVGRPHHGGPVRRDESHRPEEKPQPSRVRLRDAWCAPRPAARRGEPAAGRCACRSHAPAMCARSARAAMRRRCRALAPPASGWSPNR